MRFGWLARTLAVLVGLALVSAALLLLAWKPALAPEYRPKDSFATSLVAKGAQLAAIGNCRTCHTSNGGTPYAGARPIETPFGTIYSTNITPDRETGIGGWSEAAFTRAMREGVSRDGHHLYPAFPYDHMTRMRDEDIAAVYAFVMTRAPVAARIPANELPFPLNFRPLVAGWKLLFLDRGVTVASPLENAEWNRGAYLVEGLAHCGACHTPRNLLGAEKRHEAYAGGISEGWTAPALNAASPAPVPWDAERLHRYLKGETEPLHGIAAGPMMPVVKNLSIVADDEVRAIATYVAAIAGVPTVQRRLAAEGTLARATHGRSTSFVADASDGAMLYAGACAQCHGEAGRAPAVRALNLALSSVLRIDTADNAVRIIRHGIQSAEDEGVPVMPGFAGLLSDAQIKALVAHLRSHFTERPPWTDIDEAIARARRDDNKDAQLARMPQ